MSRRREQRNDDVNLIIKLASLTEELAPLKFRNVLKMLVERVNKSNLPDPSESEVEQIERHFFPVLVSL